jgi:L-lactate dehydrogenase complex protein LldF
MSRTQLGMPGLRPGSGNLFAQEKFPAAAHTELGNTQLHRNLKHADLLPERR